MLLRLDLGCTGRERHQHGEGNTTADLHVMVEAHTGECSSVFVDDIVVTRGPPPQPSPPLAPPIDTCCFEDCQYSSDGDCDDGGPGNDYSSCALGADCIDCGSRCSPPPPPPASAPSPPPASAPSPPPASAPSPPPASACCVEDCRYSSDGDCDDGGPGNDYSSCPLGADCIDCGSRCSPPTPPSTGNSNSSAVQWVGGYNWISDGTWSNYEWTQLWTVSNANRTASFVDTTPAGGTGHGVVISNLPKAAGKWYAELRVDAHDRNGLVGLRNSDGQRSSAPPGSVPGSTKGIDATLHVPLLTHLAVRTPRHAHTPVDGLDPPLVQPPP